MRMALLLYVVAGCGRLDFDASGGDGGPGGDVGQTIDGDASRPNLVFVTSTSHLGGFGGIAGADAICMQDAQAAGLPGTFIAFISTSTVNARDRLAGSRGWIRTDGEPVLDTVDGIFAGQMFNPIVVDENRATIPFLQDSTWSGTDAFGNATGATCNDWLPGAFTATVGYPAYQPPLFMAGGSVACANFTYRLLCFEIGHAVQVTPRVTTGRIAFVSSAISTAASLSLIDAVCATDAALAGLPGSYAAAIATKTASAESRFTLDTRPLVRPDGTLITLDITTFFGTGDLLSFTNQRANGMYFEQFTTLTGATTGQVVGTTASTCNDWTSTSNGMPQIGIASSILGVDRWAHQVQSACTTLPPVWCIQQ